jgi:hypothetical protein
MEQGCRSVLLDPVTSLQRLLDRVFQLSNVSRLLVAGEHLHGLRLYALDDETYP